MIFEDAIAEHAHRDAPNEACGFLIAQPEGGFAAVPMENKSRKPEEFFRMDAADFVRIKKSGRLAAVYHSHPGSDHLPSPVDIANADAVELPSFIYGCANGVLGCYVPPAFRKPLEGRPFMPLVHDCISLAWDFYATICGITLPFLPRTQNDYALGSKFNWRGLMPKSGARFVSDLAHGDLLLMAVNGSADVNHCGVYLGEGVILHQRNGTPSKREVWLGFWEQRTRMKIRFPGALEPTKQFHQ